MKQSVNARLQLDKRAKIGHTRNLALNDSADRVLLRSGYPRIFIRELHTEGDLRALYILYEYAQLLARLKYFLGIFNMTPRHL